MGGPGEEEARSLEGSPLVVEGPGEGGSRSLERSPLIVGGPGGGGALRLMGACTLCTRKPGS